MLLLLILSITTITGSDITITSGEYIVKVSIRYNLTIRQILYDGFEIAKPNGFYGTVLAPLSGKYIGSGHNEGGEEQILSSVLYVDGNEVAIKEGEKYVGQKIILKKIAMLDKLKFNVALEVSPEGIVERKNFEAIEDQPVNSLYAFCYCFTDSTTEWGAARPDGSIISGVFKNDGGWLINADVKWLSQFDAAAGKGFILSFPRIIKGKIRKSAFWDVPKRYHKYYLFLDTPPIIEKGFKSEEMVAALRAFSSSSTQWLKDAEKIAEQSGQTNTQ